MGFEYTDKSKQFLAKLDAKVDIAVGASSEYLAQNIQDQMPGAGASVVPGTGGDTGVKGKYVASNPGSPPGVRTNRLKGGISSQKTGKKKQRSVGTNAKYAKIQEFGGTINHPGGTPYKIVGPGKAVFVKKSEATPGMKRTKPHTITLPPRPFMRPGLKNSKRGMLRVFTNTLKKGMR